MDPTAEDEKRPLRRDARRNLERIRAAASEVFRERGLEASHEAIARAADVSVGTVYRRFPDREQLIDSLFDDEFDAVLATAESATRATDPWEGVVQLFVGTMELVAANLALRELIVGSRHGAERVSRARQRLTPLLIEVIERARRTGAIRPDVEPQDLPITILTLGPVVDAGRVHAPDLWRRQLALLLDGMRPEGAPRPALPPTVPLDVIDRVVAASQDRP